MMATAQETARWINTRIQIAIPSVLAKGESFSARFSITGPDALPTTATDLVLHFDQSLGIEGLPPSFRFGARESTGKIEGLVATGPDVALIQCRIECTGLTAAIASNPAWVFKTPPYRVYFGDLHVHTTYSNCSAWRCLSPEWCYEYARDISLLDFVAPADHLRGIASDSRRWLHLQTAARHHHEPGRFVSFLAFESSHAQGFGGDNNVYFLEDDAPLFWMDREDMKGIAPHVLLDTLWQFLDGTGKTYFTVPHHTGRAAKYRAWDEACHDPMREPLFEIYSSWGSSEMRHTRLPISGGNNDAPSYFVDALKAGARFGVIASSDDHATLPGSIHHFRTDAFHPPSLNGFAHKGLAVIRAPRLTRNDLFQSMRERATYATTHARSLIDLNIGGATMGMVVPCDTRLRSKRTIRVRFTLDNNIFAHVTLMRNGEAFDTRTLRGTQLMTAVNEIEFVDHDALDDIVLRDTRYASCPFVVYYARIEDGSGAHQWTSPIWLE